MSDRASPLHRVAGTAPDARLLAVKVLTDDPPKPRNLPNLAHNDPFQLPTGFQSEVQIVVNPNNPNHRNPQIPTH